MKWMAHREHLPIFHKESSTRLKVETAPNGVSNSIFLSLCPSLSIAETTTIATIGPCTFWATQLNVQWNVAFTKPDSVDIVAILSRIWRITYEVREMNASWSAWKLSLFLNFHFEVINSFFVVLAFAFGYHGMISSHGADHRRLWKPGTTEQRIDQMYEMADDKEGICDLRSIAIALPSAWCSIPSDISFSCHAFGDFAVEGSQCFGPTPFDAV